MNRRNHAPYIGVVVLFYLFSRASYARSLQASAESLADGIIRLGWVGAGIGIAIASLMLIFGAQDGYKRVTSTFVGSTILALASGIAQFIRAVG